MVSVGWCSIGVFWFLCWCIRLTYFFSENGLVALDIVHLSLLLSGVVLNPIHEVWLLPKLLWQKDVGVVCLHSHRVLMVVYLSHPAESICNIIQCILLINILSSWCALCDWGIWCFYSFPIFHLIYVIAKHYFATRKVDCLLSVLFNICLWSER